MNRRGTSVLLIPLLAALALFYPGFTTRTQAPPAPASKIQAKTAKQKNAPKQNAEECPTKAQECGRELVREFLGLRTPDAHPERKAPWAAGDRRNHTQIKS